MGEMKIRNDHSSRMLLVMLPGLNFCLLLNIPEKESSFVMCLEEPNLVSRRARQLVTSLHQPPPYTHTHTRQHPEKSCNSLKPFRTTQSSVGEKKERKKEEINKEVLFASPSTSSSKTQTATSNTVPLV